jgi:hypothetical protein
MTEQPGDRPEQPPDTPTKSTTSAPTDATKKATTDATKNAAEAPSRSRGTRTRPRIGSTRYGWRRIRDALATAVVIVAATVAIILAVHVVFVVFEANGANGIVKTINSWADTLAWNFKDIFTPTDPKAAALVNYGLAAAIYLIAGRVLAALIRRAG